MATAWMEGCPRSRPAAELVHQDHHDDVVVFDPGGIYTGSFTAERIVEGRSAGIEEFEVFERLLCSL